MKEAGARVAALRERLQAGDESARTDYGNAMCDWERSGFQRLHARDALDSTQEGQRELQQAIDDAPDVRSRVDAQVRIEHGIKRHEQQLERLALTRQATAV